MKQGRDQGEGHPIDNRGVRICRLQDVEANLHPAESQHDRGGCIQELQGLAANHDLITRHDDRAGRVRGRGISGMHEFDASERRRTHRRPRSGSPACCKASTENERLCVLAFVFWPLWAFEAF